MIHINLLPQEYRRRARTPLKLMAGTLAMAVVAASLLAWFGWITFGVAAEVNSEVAVLQTEMDGLTPQVKYHKSLESERSIFDKREKTLAEITTARINWTRKIDELVTIVNSGGEGVRHFVWLDDLIVSQGTDGRTKSNGNFKAAAKSGSDNFAQMANFLEDLEKSSFIEDFNPPAVPEGQATQVDKELIPAVVWAFPINLQIKPVEDRAASKSGEPAKEARPKPAPATNAAKESTK